MDFYSAQLVAVLFWWALVRVTTGKHLSSVTSSVLTRPSWLPARWLLFLASHKWLVITSLPLALALGAVAPDYVAVRALVALAVSLYHLLETAFTSRHGEYPVLYASWAMVLPDPFARAAVLGVAVHFVLQCGVGKCFVGGVRAWAGPSTMPVYLDVYRASASSGPLSRGLSRWLAQRGSVAGAGTILIECVAVPATLLLPPELRPLGTLAMLGLHAGIVLGMSLRVGLVFLTTLPTYIIGFGCEAKLGSPEWGLAMAVALLPTGLAFSRGRLLAEDWPSTPCSLFMWNGEQAERLSRLAMTGDTRIVLSRVGRAGDEAGEGSTPGKEEEQGLVGQEACTAGGRGDVEGLVGQPVLHHGGTSAFMMTPGAAGPAAHDSILRVLGFTLIHADLTDAFDLQGLAAGDALQPVQPETSFRSAAELQMVQRLLTCLERWLRRERRLIETASGMPLTSAHFVAIDDKNRITKVLASASG